MFHFIGQTSSESIRDEQLALSKLFQVYFFVKFQTCFASAKEEFLCNVKRTVHLMLSVSVVADFGGRIKETM